MGAVFEVVHLETQRRRALKLMLPELLQHAELRDRFLNEAKITANVETEYIVDVSDAGIDTATGIPFLVMELLQGQDLGKLLETGPLAPELALTCLRQVASALDKTHRAGIVHRDLKPENLFLTQREDGSPRMKMLDFGISKVVSDAATGPGVTRGIGTPLYMAPEQVLAQPVSAATDLYALALITYTLLVGVPYWQSDAERFDNSISFVIHTSRGVVESASERAARVGRSLPAGFDAWFARATSLSPRNRFSSAGEQVAALGELLGIQPSLASITRLDESPKSAERNGSSVQRTLELRTPSTAVDWTSASPPRSSKKKWAALILAAATAGFVLVSGLLISRSRVTASSAEKPEVERERRSAQSAAGSALQPVSSSTAVELEARSATASAPAAMPSATARGETAPRPAKPAAQPRAPKSAARPAPTSLYTRD
jgi:serine/threonine-protein kinase